MPGVRFEIEWHDDEVQQAFARLRQRGRKFQPLFEDIGEALLRSTQDRFRSRESPEGEPWPPLSPDYKARKRRNRNQLLITRRRPVLYADLPRP